MKHAVVVFGGSFNPPHRSHEQVIEMLLKKTDAQEVWVVPTHQHPFGKELAPFEDRLAMCRLAFARFAEQVRILDVEQQLGGVSYTVRTLEALRERHPATELRLVVGSDVMHERTQWKDFDRIIETAALVVVPRDGYSTDDERTLDIQPINGISSTEIRNRVRDGLSTDALLHPAVAHFIRENALYTDVEPPTHEPR